MEFAQVKFEKMRTPCPVVRISFPNGTVKEFSFDRERARAIRSVVANMVGGTITEPAYRLNPYKLSLLLEQVNRKPARPNVTRTGRY